MKTILVVDDEEAVVEFVGSLLEDAGYRVLRAYDGRSALELARRERPDLVVTDVMMPIMNGLELACQLRETPETRSIPVLLMTAGRIPHAPCANAAILAKPFDLTTLERAVSEALEHPPTGSAPDGR